MRRRRVLGMLGAGALLLCGACVKSSEEPAKENAGELNQDITRARSELRDWGQQRADEIDRMITEAHTRVERVGPRLKLDYERGLKDLRAKREQLQRDLASVESQTAEGLARFKADLEKKVQELKEDAARLDTMSASEPEQRRPF